MENDPPRPPPTWGPSPAPSAVPPPSPLFWGMAAPTYTMAMHLSLLASGVVPLAGVVMPIVMWASHKDNDATGAIDRHGRNIFNFMLSYFIYTMAVMGVMVAGLLLRMGSMAQRSLNDMVESMPWDMGGMILAIVLITVLGALQLIFIIVAAVKAQGGRDWRYPFCIRFFG